MAFSYEVGKSMNYRELGIAFLIAILVLILSFPRSANALTLTEICQNVGFANCRDIDHDGTCSSTDLPLPDPDLFTDENGHRVARYSINNLDPSGPDVLIGTGLNYNANILRLNVGGNVVVCKTPRKRYFGLSNFNQIEINSSSAVTLGPGIHIKAGLVVFASSGIRVGDRVKIRAGNNNEVLLNTTDNGLTIGKYFDATGVSITLQTGGTGVTEAHALSIDVAARLTASPKLGKNPAPEFESLRGQMILAGPRVLIDRAKISASGIIVRGFPIYGESKLTNSKILELRLPSGYDEYEPYLSLRDITDQSGTVIRGEHFEQ